MWHTNTIFLFLKNKTVQAGNVAEKPGTYSKLFKSIYYNAGRITQSVTYSLAYKYSYYLSQVILVDESDMAIGKMEKMEAHQKGLLHRAFSIFIFNEKGQMLLQQRALSKYHSGGLWTNACCSHPEPGENIADAAAKRLQEEMGFITELKNAFSFIYKTNFSNGLTEYEYDYVFVGNYNGPVIPNEKEVKDYSFLSINQVNAALQITPQKYSSWFKIAFPKLVDYLATKQA